ncbi:MAG: hypothetical protein K0S44_3234 [Bacteroidetes bacterium]|jgi:MFS family permease|nr:hypothetical protein [Bacteroidota bacterium]
MQKHSFKYYFILFSCFVEGGALMGVEITSSKIIAPYFGASLYVWATILGVTMGGLALGYFAGGILSEKRKYTVARLMVLFFIASLLTFLLQFSAPAIMENTIFLEIRLGIFLSCLIFLLPPIFCFGLISPISIQILISNRENIGYSTGLIYTISTVGGILFTFLTGFNLVSEFGVRFSINFIGSFLLIPIVIFGALATFNKKILE